MEKNVMTGAYTYNNEPRNFDFYTDIPVAQKLRFVHSVTSLLVDDDNYNSVIRDLVFDFYIVDIFTDINTTEFKESAFFISDVEKFLEETNVADVVKANMVDGLLDELNKSINLNIEYRTGIHPNPLNEAIASLVNTLENKIKSIDLGGVMEMVQAFSAITDDFTTENIVKAYMDTDIAKRNIAEIEDYKNTKNMTKKAAKKDADK